ncbi:MAG: hypothetical protein ACHQLA_09425 [Ignavibacteriales bacterium]
MKIEIASSRLISEIQKEFNDQFPFLKIEFFRSNTPRSSKWNAANRISPIMEISKCQVQKKEGEIQFMEETKVEDLENLFRQEFNLNVQVFRRSGNIWLETTMTDKWTLKQQNDHGREITVGEHKPEPLEPTDYELTRDADH